MLAFVVMLDLAAALSSGPLALTPGKQLGPVEIGMTEADLARLGTHEQDGERTLGPLTVTVRRGRVTEIAGNFGYYEKTRFRVGDANFRLEWQPDGGHTGEELVKLFSGCRKPFRSGEDRLWRVWRCRGVRVEERLADGDPEITIYVHER